LPAGVVAALRPHEASQLALAAAQVRVHNTPTLAPSEAPFTARCLDLLLFHSSLLSSLMLDGIG
jgi:hypothetical protein